MANLGNVKVGTMMQLSFDGGETWGEARRVSDVDVSWATYYNEPSAHIRLEAANGHTSFSLLESEMGRRARVVG